MNKRSQFLEAARQLLKRIDVFGRPARADGEELFLSALTEGEPGRRRVGRMSEARHP